MSTMVTLTARTAPLDRDLRMDTRPAVEADIPRLGEMFFSAYEPGEGSASPQAAVEDIRRLFSGGYGPFSSGASLVALNGGGEISAAILVVSRATWDDTPDSPFITHLFTAREHRRQGLAEQLVLAALDSLYNAGLKQAGVRVDADNAAALALYLSLDFRRWSAEDDE
ncbi:MAG: acetyltransferase [Micrococcaceae bacterium]|nr:acetyltransferase [Micrococcaceae bacterium]